MAEDHPTSDSSTHTCNMCGETYDRDECESCPYCNPDVDIEDEG